MTENEEAHPKVSPEPAEPWSGARPLHPHAHTSYSTRPSSHSDLMRRTAGHVAAGLQCRWGPVWC